MIPLQRACLTITVAATIFFAAAAPTEGNWKLPGVVALLALGGYFYAKHIADEREDERVRQLVEYHEQWFASMDRRRRMRGAR